MRAEYTIEFFSMDVHAIFNSDSQFDCYPADTCFDRIGKTRIDYRIE